MPWSPAIACTRSNEYLTSVDVIRSPLEKWTLCLSLHVHVLRLVEWVHPVASTGASFAPWGKP